MINPTTFYYEWLHDRKFYPERRGYNWEIKAQEYFKKRGIQFIGNPQDPLKWRTYRGDKKGALDLILLDHKNKIAYFGELKDWNQKNTYNLQHVEQKILSRFKKDKYRIHNFYQDGYKIIYFVLSNGYLPLYKNAYRKLLAFGVKCLFCSLFSLFMFVCNVSKGKVKVGNLSVFVSGFRGVQVKLSEFCGVDGG